MGRNTLPRKPGSRHWRSCSRNSRGRRSLAAVPPLPPPKPPLPPPEPPLPPPEPALPPVAPEPALPRWHPSQHCPRWLPSRRCRRLRQPLRCHPSPRSRPRLQSLRCSRPPATAGDVPRAACSRARIRSARAAVPIRGPAARCEQKPQCHRPRKSVRHFTSPLVPARPSASFSAGRVDRRGELRAGAQPFAGRHAPFLPSPARRGRIGAVVMRFVIALVGALGLAGCGSSSNGGGGGGGSGPVAAAGPVALVAVRPHCAFRSGRSSRTPWMRQPRPREAPPLPCSRRSAAFGRVLRAKRERAKRCRPSIGFASAA